MEEGSVGQFARRRFIAALGAGAIATPFVGIAQSAANLPRVGWLSPGAPNSHGHHLVAFKQGLSDLGYEVGKTILLEERWARGKLSAVAELARELVAKNVRAIVVGSTPVVIRVHKVTDSIPIVHATGVNPVMVGLADSLSKPGRNVTGITTLSESLVSKMTQLLNEAFPSLRDLLIFHNPDNANDAFFVQEVRDNAPSRWKISDTRVRVRNDLPLITSSLDATKPDAVMVLPDPVLLTLRHDIVKRVNEARTPSMFPFSEFVKAGGMMSYGVYLPANYRRAASFVDRILRGSNAGDLPIEQPREFEVVVNMRTARSLGTTIPRAFLMRANRVIE